MVAEVEAVMGTLLMDEILKAAATTPVAIPMGMTTYGLDIVVKFCAFRYLSWRDYHSVAHLEHT